MNIRSIFSLTALCLGLLASTSVTAKDYENFEIGPGFGSRMGTGLTGGSVDASTLDRQCVGYIDDTPDHIIEVTSEVVITFTVSSDTDSVLAVKRRGSQYKAVCIDDSAKGGDEEVTGTFPAGTYEIYVGNFEEDDADRYILHINEGADASIRPRANQNQRSQTPSSPRPSNRPNSTQGHYGVFTVGAGFTPDPQTATGISGYSEGGRVDAATFGKQCTGFIDNRPDHKITVTSNVNLRLTVSSNIDSTLVIRGPAGTFCDDDSAGGLDAQVNGLFTPGEYEVYVGNVGEAGEYILTVTETAEGGYVT